MNNEKLRELEARWGYDQSWPKDSAAYKMWLVWVLAKKNPRKLELLEAVGRQLEPINFTPFIELLGQVLDNHKNYEGITAADDMYLWFAKAVRWSRSYGISMAAVCAGKATEIAAEVIGDAAVLAVIHEFFSPETLEALLIEATDATA